MTENEPVEDLARPEPTEADPEPASERPARAAPHAGSDPPDPAASRPLRKKRKKRKGSDEPSRARKNVPGFAAKFPREPELDRLVDAFDRGDYRLVRAEATRLAKDDPREEVRGAARELLRRIDPDPLAVILLVAAVVLLVFLAAWYWAQGQAAS